MMNNFMNPPTSGNPYDYINPQQSTPQKPVVVEQIPTITTGGGIKPRFTIKGSEEKSLMVPVDVPVGDVEAKKPRRTRKKKEDNGSTEIIRGGKTADVNPNEVTVEESTSYTYMETTGLLKETLAQIDALNSELMMEFENVKQSRTMKNKYNTLVGISENVGSLLSNRIAAIREINNSISKSNDLDYKKMKDMRSAEAAANDDKFVTELYQSFIAQPNNIPQQPNVPQINPSVIGSNIIRANIPNGNNGQVIDESFLNYMSNLTPEQNLMRYENNPNVKQVVVFDEKTGNKFFQWMDIVSGEPIPNLEPYDTELFMPDTVIDLKTNTAKNINLNEVFPVIVINKGVASQY